jgi:tetratricopeptide (TPR) repeat protein
MQSFADELAPFVSRRPLLALKTVWPAVDLADVLQRNDQYTQAIEILKPVVLLTTHPEPYEDLADSMVQSGQDPWMTLVYLLEAARYRQGRPYIVRTLGRSVLWYARDPEWALRYLKRANTADPDDAYTHYLMASAYSRLGEVADAERHYRIAMEADAVENLRRDSLHELIATFEEAGQYQKALAEVNLLNHEFPAFANGWRARVLILSRLGMGGGLEAAEKYVELADRSDPAERAEAELFEREISAYRKMTGDQ